MARKLKIQAQQTKTISEAFSDFFLCKKALGVSDKTLKTYSQHFSAICKYLNSSALISKRILCVEKETAADTERSVAD